MISKDKEKNTYFAVVIETVVGYIVGKITNFCQLFLTYSEIYSTSGLVSNM